MRIPTFVPPAAVALAGSAAIYFLTADVFHPSLDEGIYLMGGQRVAAGQVIYKDFFAYTGPLLYWLLAALEKMFGADLPLLRLCVAIPIGVICGALCHIVTRRAGWAAGAWTAAVYLGFTLYMSVRFDINHRWLSAGLYTAAAALLLAGEEHGRRRVFAGAGVLLALAAWTTPTFVLPLAGIVVWLLAGTARRRHAWALLAGVAAVSLPVLAVLWRQGALNPMVDHLLWASGPYRQANSLPYGYISRLAERWEAGGLRALPRLALTAWPAILIPASLLLAGFEIVRRRAGRSFLLAAGLTLGLAVTAYPRWDVIQLIYVTPLAYALAAWWCAERLPDWPQRLVHAGAGMVAVWAALQTVLLVGSFAGFGTRVGMLRRTAADAEALEKLERRIPEGATVYVHPYFPLVTYLMKARNVTSYEWLQPGMMNRADEARVLRQLESNPPRFVIQQWLPEEAVLLVWPNSDRTLLHYDSIENFIGSNYLSVETVEAPNFRLTVMERFDPAAGK